jgi:cytidylate kinase
MFRVLTIGREYGSSGALIGRGIAEQLGWKLLDKGFIENIARAAKIDPQLARQFDERKDTWLERLGRDFWRGTLVAGSSLSEIDFFDVETMAALTRKMIEEAYAQGNCVIVGRGAQCLLQRRTDAFHAFIYAPWVARVERVQQRLPGTTQIDELIRSTDQQRADYIRTNYKRDWLDPHLYHLMICSGLGEKQVASTIIGFLGKSSSLPTPLAL